MARDHGIRTAWIVMLVAMALAARSASGAADPGRPLRVGGDRDYPPYSFVDATGHPAGFSVDVYEAVAEAMHLRGRVQLGPWTDVRSGIETGKLDVVIGMFRSAERDRLVDFALSHIVISHALFVRQDSPVARVEDLSDRPVIVVRGDIMDDYAGHALTARQLLRCNSSLEALQALAEGKGDAALLPRLQGLYLCREHHLRQLEAVGPPLKPTELCFAVADGQPELVGLLNEGLAIIQDNGTYTRIHQRWFGVHPAGFWERSKASYLVYALVGIIILLVLLVARGARLARELHRKQRALVETEARWHLALEGSGFGVFDWDVAEDRLVYSSQYHRLLGYEPGALGGGIGQWQERVHPDDLPASRASLERHLRGETPFYESEYRMRGADGAYRWFLARGKVLARTADGRPLRHLGILGDVTDRKLTELQLHHAKAVLEQRVEERTEELSKRVTEAERINRAMANVMQDLQGTNRKLREVSEALVETNRELEAFAHSVSHDLRAPLRAIDGFTGIVLEEYGDKLDPEGHRLLGIIRESTGRMAQLIADLLAFSRLGRQPLHQTDVAVREMIGEILGDLHPKADANVTFTVGDLPDAYGDRGMLCQAFTNLIDNAVKFSAAKPDPRITIDGTDEEGGVHYWISDNGIGFEPKYANRIFLVFERLHPPERFPGTGVGLSLVQRIIQRHGGAVWVEAEPEIGATFHIRLPRRAIDSKE